MTPTILSPKNTRLSPREFLHCAYSCYAVLHSRLEWIAEGMVSGKALGREKHLAGKAALVCEAYKARWQQWERANPVAAAQLVETLPSHHRAVVEKMRG